MAHKFPAPRWAVSGIVAEGVTVLAGQPKVGKSWLGLGMAVSVAGGGRALGQIDVLRGPALYLALEDTGARLQDAEVPRDLHIWTDLPKPEHGDETIADWCDRYQSARLIVVDVLAKMRGPARPNVQQYDADYDTVSRVKALADERGVPVVLVHHTRKAASDDFLNEVSGTNGIAGAADGVLVLKRTRGTADGILHITGRDIDEAEHAMAFDPALGLWRMLAGPASDYTLGDTRLTLLRRLRADGPATPKVIAEATGLDHELVKKTLVRMYDDDQLLRDGRGIYSALGTSVPAVPGVPSAGQSFEALSLPVPEEQVP
jgi:hypothetical protein